MAYDVSEVWGFVCTSYFSPFDLQLLAHWDAVHPAHPWLVVPGPRNRAIEGIFESVFEKKKRKHMFGDGFVPCARIFGMVGNGWEWLEVNS